MNRRVLIILIIFCGMIFGSCTARNDLRSNEILRQTEEVVEQTEEVAGQTEEVVGQTEEVVEQQTQTPLRIATPVADVEILKSPVEAAESFVTHFVHGDHSLARESCSEGFDFTEFAETYDRMGEGTGELMDILPASETMLSSGGKDIPVVAVTAVFENESLMMLLEVEAGKIVGARIDRQGGY